jgi:6-phosphofructokinase 1
VVHVPLETALKEDREFDQELRRVANITSV